MSDALVWESLAKELADARDRVVAQRDDLRAALIAEETRAEKYMKQRNDAQDEARYYKHRVDVLLYEVLQLNKELGRDLP